MRRPSQLAPPRSESGPSVADPMRASRRAREKRHAEIGAVSRTATTRSAVLSKVMAQSSPRAAAGSPRGLKIVYRIQNARASLGWLAR